jgi:hypothetical protein
MTLLPVLPNDVFRCETYSCKLTAAACMRRQKLARTAPKKTSRGGCAAFAFGRGANEDLVVQKCRDCPQGRAVAAAVST